MSQKTGQRHKLPSLRFLHDRDHLLVCDDSLVEKMLETNASNSAMDARFCVLAFAAFLHVEVIVHLMVLHLHACTGVHFGSDAVL